MAEVSEIKEFTINTRFMHCKIGSHAATSVQIDGRVRRIRVGKKIRLKELFAADKSWTEVWVDKIYPSGFFFASR